MGIGKSNKRGSVFELEGLSKRNALETMEQRLMKIIVVKGIGYIVVNEDMEDPELYRRMGEVAAELYEG